MIFKEQSRRDILEGSLLKVIVNLSIPIIIASFVQKLYNLGDTYFLGKLPGSELAAMSITFPVVQLINSIGAGIGVAGVALVAKEIGRNREDEADKITLNLVLLSSILGGIIIAITLIFGERVLALLGIEGELLEKSWKYMRWIMVASPATFIVFCYNGVKRAHGNTVKSLNINILSVIINIILNPIFIFKLNLGITGAGITTALSKYLIVIYCLYDLVDRDRKQGIKDIYDRVVLKNVLNIAIPTTISQASTSIGFILLSVSVKEYGNDVLAAYGLGNKINSLYFIIGGSIGMAVSAMVGQALGAEKYRRMEEVVSIALKISVIGSLIGVTLNHIYLEQVVGVFTKNPEIAYHAMNYMRLVSWSVLAWAIFQIHLGYFRGIGKTKISLSINMIRLWGLRIPLVLILMRVDMFKEYAIWYSMFFSNVLTALCSMVIYHKLKLKNK